jgi:TPR repeat protein
MLRRAAELGHVRGMARYGYALIMGIGGRSDPAEGEAWIRRATALGDTNGLIDLARAHENGLHGLEPDPDRALECYLDLACRNSRAGKRKLQEYAEKGVPKAELFQEIAQVRFINEGGETTDIMARRHCERLARLGADEPRAWLELGVAHLAGAYVPRDYPKAHDYLRRALAAGQQEAAFFLAFARMEGKGVPKEPEAALREMQALADAGDARAANRLGVLFYWGAKHLPGGKQDSARAFKYLRQAAAGGCSQALPNLGYCYEHGIGVKPNPVLAAKVYWTAYLEGYAMLKERVQRHLAFAKIP